jgi:hypothetical protein
VPRPARSGALQTRDYYYRQSLPGLPWSRYSCVADYPYWTIVVSTMISEIYDAFLAAGTPEDKARKAAETLANYDDRFSRLDGAVLRVQSELVLLRWMVGFVIALNIATLTRVFFR